jgi:hypothetical protein
MGGTTPAKVSEPPARTVGGPQEELSVTNRKDLFKEKKPGRSGRGGAYFKKK